jgi:hypothetical protein
MERSRQYLVRAFEAGFETGVKPIDGAIAETVLSRQIDDLEPRLTRNFYTLRSGVEQLDAEPAEARQLLRGELDPERTRQLLDEMRDRRGAELICLTYRVLVRDALRASSVHRACVQPQTACVRDLRARRQRQRRDLVECQQARCLRAFSAITA